MKYLKLFETESEYAEYREDATVFIRPNVSNCEDNPIKVYYNSSTYTPPVINIIRYTASAKLPEITLDYEDATEQYAGYLHMNSFNTPITSHTFDNGVGTIEFKYNVTSITDFRAFEGCSGITSIDLPYSISRIGARAFHECYALTSVTIPSGVTYIGSLAFDGCYALTSIEIPSGVTYIANCAFEACSGLTSVTIPSSVTKIGDAAFALCSGLTSITCESTTPPTLESISAMYFHWFDETNDCPIYVPSESVDTYKAASNWSRYASRIQAMP